MTCPECGTKIGVFRRKFSNTAYCSEACRQAARQTQNQASLALLLSNKKRHLAQALPAPAPPAPSAPPEPIAAPPERTREAVHTGALAGFAPFGHPQAQRASAGVALLEETPAAIDAGAHWQDAVLTAARPGLGLIGGVVAAMSCLAPRAEPSPEAAAPEWAEWGARWQDAALHTVRPGLGLTGWIVTAMSCIQPLAATAPAPCGQLHLPFTVMRTRACDRVHPVWEPPAAEPEVEPEIAGEPSPSPWIALAPVPARLADQWLGLSAASEFVSPAQWPQFRFAQEHPEFARFAACRPAPASLPAGPHPGTAVDGAPYAFDPLPARFDATLKAHSPQPVLAARVSGAPWRRPNLSPPPGPEPGDLLHQVCRESGVRVPRLGKLPAAGYASVHSLAMPGSAAVKTNAEAMRWRYEVRRLSGEGLAAAPPDWKLLMPLAAEAAVEAVKIKVEPAAPQPVTPIRPSVSIKDRLAGLRENIRGCPDWTRRLAFHMAWLLPLVLAGVWFGPAIKASSSGTVPAQWVAVKAAIERRSTIDQEDDFRGGLNHWNGAAGWAKSWSYDATGLLHPGMLSLYLESAGLVDYSMEFLGVIEKRALGWTYRTADMRNYYAARLALTRRGNIPTLDLERYAVIDGRQDRRVQLPLPVVLSNITSFRVRTDVKGSRFTTYLNGKIIDAWSDDRLTRGGVGFFAEPDAVVGLHWVRVIQGDDLIGRLCAQVSSAFADKKLREALH